MSIPKVGDVFALPLRAGGFGACQVIADHGDTIELMGFAPIFDAAPTLAQVLASPPLELTHHFHKGGIERTRITKAPMPSTHLALGNAPPVYTPEQPGNSYSGLEYLGLQIALQARWDALPAEIVTAFRAVQGSTQTRRIHFGGSDVDVRESVTELSIQLSADAADWVKPALRSTQADVDWRALDALPALTKLELHGWSDALPAYLRSRPLIRTLRLYDDGVTELDLSASHLSDVFLSTPKLAQVTLANGTEQLQCNSCAPQSVRFPAPAPPLRLTYYSTKHVIQKLPQGLSELSTLRIVRTPGFEPAALGGCEVRALELNEVSKVPRFEELLDAKLSALTLTDCFDFEVSKAAARKPPAELRLSFHGIRKSVATILKRAWKGHPHLEIRGIKGDAWLEANIDNPFRNWIDTERKKGEAACKAYAAALRKITKLKAPKQAELKAILKGFVAAINRLDKKYGIDTLEREHTLDGFCLLLDKAGAAKHRETWLQSFDQWRDF